MKILFVYPKSLGLRSFIKKDADILASKHSVQLFAFDRVRRDIIPLIKAMNEAQLVFSWFCGLHALLSNFLAKLFGKPSITVVGGYEVAKVPEIKYGQFANGNNQYITLWGLKLSNKVFNVSQYSRNETLANTGIPAIKLKTIYHGFTEEVFKRVTEIKKKDVVITIAHINQMSSVKKGLNLYVESAKYLPEIDFILIGPDLDGTGKKLKKNSPPNVAFTGGVFGEELSAICNQAKVYVQASIHESFGCSVAEAMLCGCVPVVTNSTALPEVVGETGFFSDCNDPRELAVQIKKAMQFFDQRENKSIERVRLKFPMKLRSESILQEVDKLFQEN